MHEGLSIISRCMASDEVHGPPPLLNGHTWACVAPGMPGLCGFWRQGDMVLISERHPLDDDLVVEGVVLERARR